MTTARRRFGRLERHLPIEIVHEGVAHAGTTENIGLGGVFIHTDATVPFDAMVGVRLTLPTPKMVIAVPGRVLWQKPGAGVGLSFDALRPIDVWGLLQYFNASQKEQDAAVVDTAEE